MKIYSTVELDEKEVLEIRQAVQGKAARIMEIIDSRIIAKKCDILGNRDISLGEIRGNIKGWEEARTFINKIIGGKE